jgi:hypothetical protein
MKHDSHQIVLTRGGHPVSAKIPISSRTIKIGYDVRLVWGVVLVVNLVGEGDWEVITY